MEQASVVEKEEAVFSSEAMISHSFFFKKMHNLEYKGEATLWLMQEISCFLVISIYMLLFKDTSLNKSKILLFWDFFNMKNQII